MNKELRDTTIVECRKALKELFAKIQPTLENTPGNEVDDEFLQAIAMLMLGKELFDQLWGNVLVEREGGGS